MPPQSPPEEALPSAECPQRLASFLPQDSAAPTPPNTAPAHTSRPPRIQHRYCSRKHSFQIALPFPDAYSIKSHLPRFSNRASPLTQPGYVLPFPHVLSPYMHIYSCGTFMRSHLKTSPIHFYSQLCHMSLFISSFSRGHNWCYQHSCIFLKYTKINTNPRTTSIVFYAWEEPIHSNGFAVTKQF